MGNRLTLSDKINEALNTGKNPPELAAITSESAILAGGVTVSKITDASTAHALNSTFSDTEVEAALNALGTKINTIIDALEAFKISSSS